MTRTELEYHIASVYGIKPDYPFPGDFVTGVFRHPENRKWFAIAMQIPKSKLGIREDGLMDVVNIKYSPEVPLALHGYPGIYPAYHMNRKHWLTLALDGSVDTPTLTFLLEGSFHLTKNKRPAG